MLVQVTKEALLDALYPVLKAVAAHSPLPIPIYRPVKSACDPTCQRFDRFLVFDYSCENSPLMFYWLLLKLTLWLILTHIMRDGGGWLHGVSFP